MKRLQTQSSAKSVSRLNSKLIELNLKTLETPRHTLHSDVDYNSAPPTVAAKVPTSPTCDTPDSPESAFYEESYNPESVTSNNNAVCNVSPIKIKQEPMLEPKLEPKLDLDQTSFASKDICLSSLDLPIMRTDNRGYCHTNVTSAVRQTMNFNVKQESSQPMMMNAVVPTTMLMSQSSIMSSVPTTTTMGTTGVTLDDPLLETDDSLTSIGRSPVKLEELMNNFGEISDQTLTDLSSDIEMQDIMQDFEFTRSEEIMCIFSDWNNAPCY